MANESPGGMGCGGNNGPSFDPNATSEARVMRLRGYGNAIIAEVARGFIEAYMLEVQEKSAAK